MIITLTSAWDRIWGVYQANKTSVHINTMETHVTCVHLGSFMFRIRNTLFSCSNTMGHVTLLEYLIITGVYINKNNTKQIRYGR